MSINDTESGIGLQIYKLFSLRYLAGLALILLIPIVCFLWSCFTPSADHSDIPPIEGWKLVWHDDFNGTGHPSEKNWDYETGFVRNREEQYYTERRLENARLENGSLIIEARKEEFPNPSYKKKAPAEDWQHSREKAAYTSAALMTLGQHEWLYGKLEIRAKLPRGKGSWPALWMMGCNIKKVGWPSCGELDVMEYVSGTPQTIYGTTHWNPIPGSTKHVSKGFTKNNPTLTNAFHLYGIEWDKDRIIYLFDDKPYGTFELSRADRPDGSNPFRLPHYLILNLALGGNWGGEIGDEAFPRQFVIDYVRLYEKESTPAGEK